MASIQLIEHSKGAPGLRLIGLGPNLMPTNGIKKLKDLFDNHTFWAKNRSEDQIKKLLAGSTIVISAWQGKRIVGFGRATSDGIYRAVLWDVIVPRDLQGRGIGKIIVEALLNAKKIQAVERVYLMTSNSADFYNQFQFRKVETQSLLLLEQNNF